METLATQAISRLSLIFSMSIVLERAFGGIEVFILCFGKLSGRLLEVVEKSANVTIRPFEDDTHSNDH